MSDSASMPTTARSAADMSRTISCSSFFPGTTPICARACSSCVTKAASFDWFFVLDMILGMICVRTGRLNHIVCCGRRNGLQQKKSEQRKSARFRTENHRDKPTAPQLRGPPWSVHELWAASHPEYAGPYAPGSPDNRRPACDGSENKAAQRT